MSTFVLVHGAWTGAYAFRHVRKLLQAQGHDVFTPSLTGIGDRAHLASPMVDLRMHVRDVVNLVLYEDLKDIVLLGFSYGGFVVSGALEHIAQRVSHLVFLDAFVPESSGQSVAEFIRGPGRPPVEINEAWQLPTKERDFDSPEEGQWVSQRRSPQPAGTFTDPVYLAKPLEDYSFTRTYVKAMRNPPEDAVLGALGQCAARARSSSAWRYHEIDTGHMIPSNRPAELVEMLVALTRD
jgi:pimeloyl-ACP methyl ester carboxylesterase